MTDDKGNRYDYYIMKDEKLIEKEIENLWEEEYQKTDISKLPLESFETSSRLIKLVESGKIKIGKALDIGCGLGTNIIYLAQKGFDVTALDVSRMALKYASKMSKDAGVKIKFVHGFAHKLNFPDKTFSLVFDRGCFHHIPQELWKDYIEGVHRILEDSGKYYLECFCNKCGFDYGYKFSKADIENLFGSKFKILTTEEFKNTDVSKRDVLLYSVFMEKRNDTTHILM